jgi:hypothetical protein
MRQPPATYGIIFSQLRSPEGSRLLGELGAEPGITWYDVLGVLPSATVEQVQYQHDANWPRRGSQSGRKIG